MKSKVIWMVLFLVAVLSPCGKAEIWNPDGDPCLVFNLNFETDTNGTPPTTTDAKAGLVGDAYDFNDHDANNLFHMWNAPNSRWRAQGADANNDANAARIGNFVGDFRRIGDYNSGKIWDACVMMPANFLFKIGTNGQRATTLRTFTLWFWPEAQTVSGTFIRHANADASLYPNLWWEIRMYEGKLHFFHKSNFLRMETVDTLADMVILPNTWHHVAVVYDRSEREKSQIFIDGVQVDSIVTEFDDTTGSSAEVDPFLESRVKFGGGDSEFDGMLDEFRIYHRVLTPSEVSILYQTDYKTHAIALTPFPNASIVAVTTDLVWYPDPNATRQTLYFDDDNDVCSAPLYTVNDDGNDLNSVANASIGGPLPLNATYYWAVDTNVNGTIYKGSVWKFKTEDGKAYNPIPDTNTEDIPVGSVNLKWTGCPSAESYDVYFDSNQTRVTSNDPLALVADDITDANFVVSAATNAQNYYWRVVSNMSEASGKDPVNSDVWRFRTEPYAIVFNTDDNDVVYKDQNIPGYTCMVYNDVNGWTTRSTGTIASDGVIIFDFNGFNYSNRYEIIVLPKYDDTNDSNETVIYPTPLGIDVNGSFYFDGRMNISGAESNSSTVAKACCGGHHGPQRNAGNSPDYPEGDISYRDNGRYRLAYDGFHRYNTGGAYNKDWYPTEPNGYFWYGEGTGVVPTYKVGGGGGYGGLGGNSGRGYFAGIFSGGNTYGDKEVPVPFGGSAGAWGSDVPGGAGGGGVEIVATGNVTLDSNSVIRANGSDITYVAKYPSSGGSGGSLKIISDANVTIKGIISVNGGRGGKGNEKANNTGGGGGGGRVAVFYKGTAIIDSNKITANGGVKGVIVPGASFPHNEGFGLAEDGKAGTINAFNSSTSPRKASAPTPKNGDKMAYNDGNGIKLKWYSGYNVSSANDVVYFGTASTPITQIGLPVAATRGQHTSTINATVTNELTYFWKVRTIPADGNIAAVDSNVWSCKVVGWQCVEPNDNDGANTGIGWDGWPEWDTYPMDCIINFNDFWYFARDWRVDRGGESTIREYTNDFEHFYYGFATQWLECRGRTNNGCLGW